MISIRPFINIKCIFVIQLGQFFNQLSFSLTCTHSINDFINSEQSPPFTKHSSLDLAMSPQSDGVSTTVLANSISSARSLQGILFGCQQRVVCDWCPLDDSPLRTPHVLCVD